MAVNTSFSSTVFETNINGEIEEYETQVIPYSLNYTASKFGFNTLSGTAILNNTGNSGNLVKVILSPRIKTRFTVRNAVDNSLMAAVSIATNSSTYVTDESGTVEFDAVLNISYTLNYTASKPGFTDLSGTAFFDKEADNVKLVPVVLSPRIRTRFTVRNAVDNSLMAAVFIATNTSTYETDVIGTVEFDAILNISYTLNYTASKPGFTDFNGTAIFDKEADDVKLVPVVLSPRIRTRFTVRNAVDNSLMAAVSIATKTSTYKTDDRGTVEFDIIKNIPYTLNYTASKPGYTNFSGTADLDLVGSVNSITISLFPNISTRFLVTNAVDNSVIDEVSINTSFSGEILYTSSEGEVTFDIIKNIPSTLNYTASKPGYTSFKGTVVFVKETNDVNLVPVSLSPAISLRFIVRSDVDDSLIAGMSITTNLSSEVYLTGSNGETEIYINQIIPFSLKYTASKFGYVYFIGTAVLDKVSNVNLVVPVSGKKSHLSAVFQKHNMTLGKKSRRR